MAALLVGVGIGASGGGTDPTTTTQYKSIAKNLSTTKGQLADTTAELDKANADLAKTKADLETAVGSLPQREAKLKDDRAALSAAQKKLAADQAALAKAQTSVAKREKKVGIIEKDIAANTIGGEGIYEVGRDMKAGSYRTTGTTDINCYYAVLGDANGNNIKSNNNTTGPAIVTVRAGEYFQTSGCREWALSR